VFPKNDASIVKPSVLILGGSGFLGRALSKGLEATHNIVSTSRKAGSASSVHFSLDDPGSLGRLLKEGDFETVINLVGNTSESTRGLSLSERGQMFSQFLDAEDNLVDRVRIIHIGSRAEYGASDLPLTEHSKPSNLSPYGKGKLEETQFFCSLSSRGYRVLVLRPSIVFGPSQTGTMLVPSAIRALQEGKKLDLLEPKEIRDFLYEKDFASAVLAVLNSEWTAGQIFNVGSGWPITVQEFIDELSRRLDQRAERIEAQTLPQHNQGSFIEMDISLIEQEFGWSPKFDYKSAIEDLTKGLRS